MGQLYALLVGIDAYRGEVRPLYGCRADVLSAAGYLRSNVAAPQGWEPLVLLDEQATRAAVISAFRTHLGRAGHGDTALFWFSGHGSAVDWPRQSRLEPSRKSQSLLCFDSRHDGVLDLSVDAAQSEEPGEVEHRGRVVGVVVAVTDEHPG